MRRGLPRVVDGDPWPPATVEVVTAATAAAEPSLAGAAPVAAPQPTTGQLMRRGLPRVDGGEPWPPEAFVPHSAAAPQADPELLAPAYSQEPLASEAPVPVLAAEPLAPVRRKIVPPAPRVPRRIGPFTVTQWVGGLVLTGIALFTVAAGVVAVAQWLRSLEAVQGFMAQFPGEYPLPEGSPIGVPAWMGWQHFFNVFLMVLVIRSGLQIRREQRPAAYWTPKWNSQRKISLNIWFHQSLDLLWVVNGAIFIVLLFVTGQWAKIVPTSWEVFPNALSAGLQYLTLEWPTENGWVNYNSLQQLMYFTVVFIAAPLAAVTGVRMSEWWPERARRLNRLYPAPLARAIHFPVMLFFVLFVIVHVFLVLATGALRNLNHIFAGTDQVNWAGFWWFVVALLAATAVGRLARPLVIAPIANLFGRVSNR
jgi:thiosulfate reductase cytochrome b subunit